MEHEGKNRTCCDIRVQKKGEERDQEEVKMNVNHGSEKIRVLMSSPLNREHHEAIDRYFLGEERVLTPLERGIKEHADDANELTQRFRWRRQPLYRDLDEIRSTIAGVDIEHEEAKRFLGVISVVLSKAAAPFPVSLRRILEAQSYYMWFLVKFFVVEERNRPSANAPPMQQSSAEPPVVFDRVAVAAASCWLTYEYAETQLSKADSEQMKRNIYRNTSNIFNSVTNNPSAPTYMDFGAPIFESYVAFVDNTKTKILKNLIENLSVITPLEYIPLVLKSIVLLDEEKSAAVEKNAKDYVERLYLNAHHLFFEPAVMAFAAVLEAARSSGPPEERVKLYSQYSQIDTNALDKCQRAIRNSF